ncbi:MAG: M48 family metalloprotease [Sphingomonadales bacterium]
MKRSKFQTFIILLITTLFLAACISTNPATGKKQFSLISSSQEAALGAEEHPKLVAQFGGKYDDATLAAYVERVGDGMAVRSEMPDVDFSFTLLNSPIVNAFALPGGYVHISRGLMAYFNDEAEMASVLGHEIGHVTARHAASRYTKSVIFGGLAAGAGLLIKSESLSSLIGTSAQLYVLSYSRGQETQSDGLGLRYMVRTGHDPMGSVRMLEALETTAALAAKKSGGNEQTVPTWARTHPLTSERIADQKVRVANLDPEPATKNRNRDRYLDAIDGMIFGDDPAQGIIKGQQFLHPVLRLGFTAPDGFALHNSASALVGVGPDDARFLFTGGLVSGGLSTRNYLDQSWAELFEGEPPAKLTNIQNLSTNGMDGLTGTARLKGEGGNLDIRMVAWRYDATHAYYFLMITPEGGMAKYLERFHVMVTSFRKLTAAEASAIKPLRIRIITVGSGDTVSGLAARMDVAEFKEETFRALNGLGDNEGLQAGQRVKIVVEG